MNDDTVTGGRNDASFGKRVRACRGVTHVIATKTQRHNQGTSHKRTSSFQFPASGVLLTFMCVVVSCALFFTTSHTCHLVNSSTLYSCPFVSCRLCYSFHNAHNRFRKPARHFTYTLATSTAPQLQKCLRDTQPLTPIPPP